MNIDKELNLIGLRCPEPIMEVRKHIRKLESGNIVYIKTDDPSTTRDIPSFCRFLNHILIKSNVSKTPYEFWIQKS